MRSIDHIDLNLLRVFQVIIEEHSLTRAGERLALSQPAVSYALGRLRVLFDDPLFIRTRMGMQPTPVALEISSSVTKVLDAVREALRYVEKFDPATSTRTFRLSLSDAGEMVYLPALCRALRREAPGVRISVQSLPIKGIVDALRASKLDLAVGNLPELTPYTRHRLLFEETYVCMTRRRPGLPQGPCLSLAHFLKAGHIRVRSPEHSHYSLDDALRAQGAVRDIMLDVPHFVALPGMLAATDLYVTLPERLAHILNADKSFRIYALPISLPSASITMHWHEHFDAEEGLAWMRGLIEAFMRDFDKAFRKDRAR